MIGRHRPARPERDLPRLGTGLPGPPRREGVEVAAGEGGDEPLHARRVREAPLAARRRTVAVTARYMAAK